MKVSVITVSFNAAPTIRHTVESFLGQSHPDKELIVIDGGSRDGTVEIVRSFAAAEITLVSEPDRGMYDAANKGLRIYRGEAVGFLNADDRYHDDAVLSDIAAGLETGDMVHGHLDFVHDHRSREIVRRWRATPYRKGSFRSGWMPAHPTLYVRRAVIGAVGWYDLAYRVAADYDWMLRACELHEFKTVLLDRVVIDMMAGGSSTVSLSAHVKHNIEALRSRRQWLGSGLIDYALMAKPLRKLNQFASVRRHLRP